MRWLAPLIALAALGLGLAPGAPSHAAPTIEIKAQTQLVLEQVRLLADGRVEVRGVLVDRLTGRGIPDQVVTVRIGDGDAAAIARSAPTAQEDGRFTAVLFDVPAGPQPIELGFAGGGLLDRAEPFSTTTDPSRAQVALELRAEEAPGGVHLIAAATVDDQAAELPIELSFGPPGGDLKPLARTRTGTPVLLTRAAAGGPGTQRIRAAYAGDGSKQPATAELTVDLDSATKTTMELSSTSLAYEDELVATGAVTDEEGRPVARAAVTLSAGDRRLAQGVTGDDGKYRFEIEAEIFGQGQFGVKVHAEPSSAAIRPSDSPPAIIKIAAPQPVPVAYTIAAFLATALAAGGFFTARAKPWLRFRRPAPPADAPAHAGDVEQADGGLVLNKPGLVSTLRRPHDDGFSGAVRDTVRGRPVEGALVRLLLGDGGRSAQEGGPPDSVTRGRSAQESGPPDSVTRGRSAQEGGPPDSVTRGRSAQEGGPPDSVTRGREQRTAADGGFALEKLAAGEWRAEVTAPGHVTQRFVVSIPHRGELRGVRIDLVPVRERVFQLYRRAAEPVLPESRLWGIWSPRQIVDHVRALRPSPALAELTDFVEEVYFSARISDEAILPAASERVDQAIRERARAAHGPA